MSVSHPVFITQIFQFPAVIVMSIAATRMHRSLTDFAHSGYHTPSLSPFCPHANCGRCRRSAHSYPTPREQTANSDPSRKFSAPISLDRVEVALHTVQHTSSGESPSTKTGQDALYGSYSAHIHSQDKSITSDIENGVERG